MHNSSATEDPDKKVYFRTDQGTLRPKKYDAIFPIAWLEVWKDRGLELWMTWDSWEECFQNAYGDLGQSTLPEGHPHRRRDWRLWAREHVIDYLNIKFMDHDWEDNVLNALTCGHLDPNTFKYEQGVDQPKPCLLYTSDAADDTP